MLGEGAYGIAGFNPTLVRLRRSKPKDHVNLREPFQSHAGSIEATDLLIKARWLRIVSIPRWFD